MTNAVTIKVAGLADLDRALGELTKATARNVLRRVLTKAAQPMADAARRLAPDDPKTKKSLRETIIVTSKSGKKVGSAEFAEVLRAGGTRQEAGAALRSARREAASKDSFATVYVGMNRKGFYGMFQEFGTSNHAAQPFLRPAFDANKDRVVEVVKSDLGAEIKKASARAAKRALKLASRA